MGKEIRLGRDVETGQVVTLSPEARVQHLYVIGQTRTGKTTLLLNIALQDLEDREAGLCLLDLHGDVSLDLVCRMPKERQEDVIFWDATDTEWPIGLNLFECQDPQNDTLVDRISNYFIETMMRIFPEAFVNAPRMEELMFNLAIAFIQNGYTLAETTKFLEDEEYRQQFMDKISNPAVKMFWESFDLKSPRLQAEISASTLNKVGRFLSNVTIRNIVGQAKGEVAFRKVMDEGKILILRIPKGLLGEPNAALLGLTLVQKILEAAFARAEIPREKRRRFHLIADEYQLLASTTFPSLQSEAAKFGIDTVVAHQYRDQLDLENKGSTLNVGNLVIFTISGKDAQELAKEFDNTPPPPLVIGEREFKGLSHSPWSELERNSHRNPRVTELVEKLKLILTPTVYRYGKSDDYHRYEIFTFKDHEEISYCIKHLDAYLAARMRGESELEELVNMLIKEGPFGYSRRPRKDHVMPWLPWIHSDLFWLPAAIIRHELESFYPDEPKEVERGLMQIGLKLDFLGTVQELGDLLEKDPVAAPTGQTEPIYEKPRLYSDVEAETANKLATLRKYQARCKLIQDEELFECTVKTFPEPEIPDGGSKRADLIRENSRKNYGRPRKEVEKEIEKRLMIKPGDGQEHTITDYE